MELNEILKWISNNGLAAFLIGCFLTTMAGLLTNFLIGVARALTGKYPPAPSVVQCNCEEEDDD